MWKQTQTLQSINENLDKKVEKKISNNSLISIEQYIYHPGGIDENIGPVPFSPAASRSSSGKSNSYVF